MRDIAVDDSTYERLNLMARVLGVTHGAVVRLLLDRIAEEPAEERVRPPASAPPASAPAPIVEWIDVYSEYRRHRVDGRFNPSTMEVQITTSPWSGKTFSSPTAAAIAVLEQFPSGRETSSTNGRKFWRLRSNGRDLRSVVGQR